MALTDEQALKFIEQAQAAGVPEDEIRATLRNEVTGFSAANPPLPGQETGAESAHTAATKVLPPLLGAGAGGPIANAVVRAALPRLAARLPGPVVSAAGQAAGSTLGFRATGMPWLDAIKAGLETGAWGGSVEGFGNILARGGGSVAHIEKPAIDAALRAQNPIEAAHLTRFPQFLMGRPAADAEDKLASTLAQNLKAEKAGKIPMVGMEAAKTALRAAPTMEIDAAPIKAKLQSMKRQPIGGKMPTHSEEIANEGIDDALARVPDKFANAEELHSYLQRIRQPIADTLGRPVKSLVANDAKELQAFIADLRDQNIGPTGAKGFAAAHQRMNDIEKVLPSLVDESGNLRPTAENVMKRSGNAEIMRRLQAADPDTAEAVRRLAIQRQWSRKTTLGVGRFMLERMLAKPIAKTAAVLARPAGIAAASTRAFLTAMQPTPMEQKIDQLKRPNP